MNKLALEQRETVPEQVSGFSDGRPLGSKVARLVDQMD